MALWMLLVSIASLVPAFSGLLEGSKSGWLGGIAGLLLGVGIGLAWGYMLFSIRKATVRVLTSKWTVGALYLGIFLSSFVSGGLASGIVRVLFRT